MRSWPLMGVLVLAACSPGSSQDNGARASGAASARAGGVVVVGRPSDAIGLDPARITDNESVEVIEQIYDKLIAFDTETRELKPSLATSWDVADEGREWTFHLRRGVLFHDGTELTSEAVVFSFERQRFVDHPYHLVDGDNWKYEYWETTYRNIESVEAVDKYTVRIRIERRYAPFAANVAMFPVAIVSPAAVKKWGIDYGRKPAAGGDRGLGARGAAVGTGPFRFAGWVDNRIILERNPDYWGRPAKIDRLVFVAIPDGRQRLIALESGIVDIAYSILPHELQFVQLHPELVLHRAAANNVAYLAMNTERGILKDRSVRRAINHAINKEPIVKLIYQGLAEEARSPMPPTQWGMHRAATQYEYDPERARSLIAKVRAGDKEAFDEPLRLLVPETPRPYLPDPAGVARVIAANLEAVGLQIEVVAQPFEQHLYGVRSGIHDLCIHGWVGDNGDPDNYLYVLFDSTNAVAGSARNVAFFTDPELHGLLTLAQESEDRRERERIYARAQELIAREAPWVPLVHSQVAIAARKNIGGLSITPSTTVPYVAVERIEQ